MKLALLACLAACGKSSPPPPPPSTPVAIARDAPVVIADAAIAAPTSPIPATTKQLVTVIVPDWDATSAELRLWTRDGASWKPAGPAWQGVVGRTGAAWGAGLHGRGAPSGRSGPIKHEGDGKSPAGVFALAGTYGYAAAPPKGAGLAYTKVDPSWKCVDDPRSPHYNQILDQDTTKLDWTSAEEMRRSDALYAWVVDIAHNASRTPGDGSCIFLHVWSGPGSSTVGCTAMDERALAALIATLAASEMPGLVLLPRAEYDALALPWSLPR